MFPTVIRLRQFYATAMAFTLIWLGVTFPCAAHSSDASTLGSTRAANAQRLAKSFERLRQATSVTIFQADGFWPRCQPWTFPRDRVIDCRPIIQEVEAPSRAWCDSLVALFTEPGGVSLPGQKLCGTHDDVGLRFTARGGTTTIWLTTGCATGAILTAGSGMWFDFDPLRDRVRSMVYAAMPRIEHESLGRFEYCDTPPSLLTTPPIPAMLRLQNSSRADTILFDALIRKDGRVRMLKLRHGVAGLDSAAASLASEYAYRPGLSGKRPVAAWTTIAVPIRGGSKAR